MTSSCVTTDAAIISASEEVAFLDNHISQGLRWIASSHKLRRTTIPDKKAAYAYNTVPKFLFKNSTQENHLI